jgi:hypothetical protein
VKIEREAARSLQQVVENNLRTAEELQQRLCRLRDQDLDETATIAAAYYLHNTYSALENCFDQISRSFENHVVDLPHWHRELLFKMFNDLTPLRPAVLPLHLRPVLHELLGFRHVFRNNYENYLDAERLRIVWRRWDDASAQVIAALRQFAAQLAAVAG